MEDIFDLEKEVILEAESSLQLKSFSSEEDEERYKKLLKAYKRLLKQMKTMVKMSDIMQSKLNSMSGELEKLSQIDGLTGLYNRRFFNEIYLKEWKNAIATGTKLGAMMIDIDYFKVYNDTYGHLAGDVCLQKIAASIGQTVKDLNVYVGRFGGEEFILLLPCTDAERCSDIAQKIMEDIAELSIPSAVKTVGGNVTVSIGIGLVAPSEETKPESLVNAADQALYRAKKDGRNCWRV
jgi:diguanylate cyclase (GGDEF)-like protein